MTINIKERLKNATTTTVADITLVDKESGIQLESITLKDCNIEFTEEQKEIKGGQGNPTLFAWNSNREIKVSLTDVVSRLDWIASKLGQKVKNGSVDVWKQSKEYEVSGTKIKLEAVPSKPSDVKIFNIETGEELNSGDFSISGSDVTFSGDSIPNKVLVYGYKTQISEASYIDIAHDTFAKTFEVYISIPLIEKDGNQVRATMVKQYHFPLGQLSGAFTENTSSSGDGSDYGTEIKILKPDSGNMGRLLIFDLDKLTPTQRENVLGSLAKKG